MKLNSKNYFTLKNKKISSSKIKDWLLDKNYFYRKHVLGTVEKEGTSALRIGQAVDFYCFNSLAKFTKKYAAVARRSKEPPKGITELPMSEYEEVIALGQKVKSQQAFKDLKGFKFQKILQVERPIGIFNGICGVPDAYYIDTVKKHAIIFDLKTAKTISPSKYFWHCVQFGYFMQAAMYSILIKEIYKVETFEYRHLVVEKDSDGIHNCQTFILDNEIVEREIDRINNILKDISVEVDFLPSDADWSKAIVIGKAKVDESDGEGVEI